VIISAAIAVLGAAAATAAAVATAGAESPIARLADLQRWYLMRGGCAVVAAVLAGLGALELARRVTGRARTLTQLGAALWIASAAWPLARAVVLASASGESAARALPWVGAGLEVLALTGSVVVALGAGAWRRAPLAAAALVIADAASPGLPGVGALIFELVGLQPERLLALELARTLLSAAGLLGVAAALVRCGPPPAPDAAAAARGLLAARSALLFRVAAAAILTPIVVTGRSEDVARAVGVAGPAIVVIAMAWLAIGLVRAASMRVAGLPAGRLVLGAALTLWWGAVQAQQLTVIAQALRGPASVTRDLIAVAQHFAILGPLVVTAGLALVASAIGALAAHRADAALREATAARASILVVATVASAGLQLQVPTAASLGVALGLVAIATGLAIAALVALVGLLGRAAAALEAEPSLPPARVV
jgi:hypothetical protein